MPRSAPFYSHLSLGSPEQQPQTGQPSTPSYSPWSHPAPQALRQVLSRLVSAVGQGGGGGHRPHRWAGTNPPPPIPHRWAKSRR